MSSERNIQLGVVLVIALSAITGAYLAFTAPAAPPTTRATSVDNGGAIAPSASAPVDIGAMDRTEHIRSPEISDGGASTSEFLLACRDVVGRPVEGCGFSVTDVETMGKVEYLSGGDGTVTVDLLTGHRYGITASRVGFVVSSNPLPRGFVEVVGPARLDWTIQEPHACAFRIEGPQPYDIFFTEDAGTQTTMHKSRHAARMERDLSDKLDAYVSLYLLKDPYHQSPRRRVHLFYPDGVSEHELLMTPVSQLVEPQALKPSPGERAEPESSPFTFSCMDLNGSPIDIGTIVVRRTSMVSGFLKASIASNTESLVPVGDYRIGLYQSYAPWLIVEAAQASHPGGELSVTSGQGVGFTIKADVANVTVRLPSKQGALTLSVKRDGRVLTGAAINVTDGQSLMVPKSTEVIHAYQGGRLLGQVEWPDWSRVRVLDFSNFNKAK